MENEHRKTITPDLQTSFLASWLAAHNIPEDEGMYKSKIDSTTWGILLQGGITIPSIALAVGKNLGMKPDEVMHLSHALDKERFWNSDMLNYRTENFDPQWYLRVNNYSATRVTGHLIKPRRPPKAKVDNVCLLCGETFKQPWKRKYCPSCLKVMNALKGQVSKYNSSADRISGLFCKQCGRPLKTVKGEVKGAGSRYCSESCVAKHIAHKTEPMESRLCLYCRKGFIPNTPLQQYCCSNHLAYGVGVIGREEKVCKNCGLAFVPSNPNKQRQKYCSYKCRMQARYNKRRSGYEVEGAEGATDEVRTINQVLSDS